jgi:putative hydrolase of the HAD superfamily
MNKSKNNIKAVVFDVGGVLIENPWKGTMRYFAGLLQLGEEEFETVLNEIFDDFQCGRISEDEVWKHIMTRHNLEKKNMEGRWIEGIKSVFQEKIEMVTLVKQLKNRGYTVAILSNTEPPVAPFLQHRFKPHFHTMIFSSEVGLAKPQKEIYEHTLIKLQTLPHETVFIDDKVENIEGAKKTGIHAIHYTTHEEFLEKFSHYVKLG